MIKSCRQDPQIKAAILVALHELGPKKLRELKERVPEANAKRLDRLAGEGRVGKVSTGNDNTIYFLLAPHHNFGPPDPDRVVEFLKAFGTATVSGFEIARAFGCSILEVVVVLDQLRRQRRAYNHKMGWTARRPLSRFERPARLGETYK